jgi:WD40 repeat protein
MRRSVPLSPLAVFLVLGAVFLVLGAVTPLRAGEELQAKLLKPEGGVESIAIGPDGRRLVTGGKEDSRLWDLKADDPSAKCLVLRGSAGPISRDGKWLLTVGNDQVIRVWDLKADDPFTSAREAARYDARWKPLRCMAISTSNRWLVTTGEDRVLRLWYLNARGESAQPRVLIERHGGDLVLSPDGRWLACGSRSGSVGVWDLESDDPPAMAVVRRIKDKGYAGTQGISPDGRWLVTVDPERRLWDLRAKDPWAKCVAQLSDTIQVRSLDFSADGRWLVSGGDDGRTRLYDLKATDPAAKPVVITGHAKDQSVREVAISPNGRWLVTGSWDQTARIWDMETADPSAKKCRSARTPEPGIVSGRGTERPLAGGRRGSSQ